MYIEAKNLFYNFSVLWFTDCSVDLMILDSAQLSASSGQSRLLNKGSRIHSKVAWCPSSLSASEYIQINLGAIRRISGFGVQGDSENDKWPTTVKFGVSNCSSATSELTKVKLASYLIIFALLQVGSKTLFLPFIVRKE